MHFLTRSKKDHEGKNKENPLQAHSNQFHPHVCSVLASSNYFISNHDLLCNGAIIFPGVLQYNRLLKFQYSDRGQQGEA